MKYSLPTDYYRLLASELESHQLYFWDPDREVWMDEDGFEVDICRVVPPWALTLALEHFGPGKENYFAFTPDAKTLVELYFPDEEVAENWYS